MDKKKTVAQKIFLQIQEEIINGELEDGAIITERGLEQRYHVSRTPIKEALKLLEAEGWIEITPRQETRVLPLDVKEILDILPIRIAMEDMAACLCIQNMNEEMKENFSRLLKDLREMKSKLTASEDCLFYYNSLDDKFHNMIYDYSRNKMLINFWHSLRSLVTRIYKNIKLDSQRIEDGSEEVCRVIEYILCGNVPLAEAYATKHIINSVDQKLKVLQAENAPKK
jgi:DNA-binding GntR family transcriptional regulator